MAFALHCPAAHVRPAAICRVRPVPTAAGVQRSCRRHVRQAPSHVVAVSNASCDPLASRTVYESGFSMPIHSEAQLDSFTNDGTGRLMIVMCKSSHCKPCKAFMQTYHQFAERFSDSVFLEVVGDESPELRGLMKKWAVKVTPTFRLHRDGQLVETVTGTGNSKLLKAILAHLKDGERGRDFVEETHEELMASREEEAKA